jgi:LCP family protein required for cell wall assembly
MKTFHHTIWIAVVLTATLVVLGGTTGCTLVDQVMAPAQQATPSAATRVVQVATAPPAPPDTAPPDTAPPAPPAEATPTAVPADDRATEIGEEEVATGLCGQQGSTTVLFLGESLPEDRTVRGASAIRLIHIDYDENVVRVLALPPYLQVDTPALASAGLNKSPLTLVYWEGMSMGTGGDRANMASASSLVAQTLADNFGLMPDNYVTIKQGTFVKAIDALGGLPINLPEDVDGSPSGFPHFRAGEQVLGGQAVLDYVRIYPAVGDEEPFEWARLQRQHQVIQALRAQLGSPETLAMAPALRAQLGRPETLTRLPALARQLYNDVVTDLGLGQVLALACAVWTSDMSDISIEYLSLAPESVTTAPGNVLEPNVGEISAFLATSFTQ